MADNQDKDQKILEILETFSKRQEDFSREMNHLRLEIDKLKSSSKVSPKESLKVIPKELPKESSKEFSKVPPKESFKAHNFKNTFDKNDSPKQSQTLQASKSTAKSKPTIDLEKFIGENLINKIGIIITIIGVVIGTKYSIEHELISPLTRIIMGYLTAIGLLGFGIKLKEKYISYSAVLVSGAIAIMYFITYSAYTFYGLIPQGFAFALMVFFTFFTVVAALNYNKQVIAHIGLVGAYGVPFLLSNESGAAGILFSYVTIINIGILIISFKKYWKSLYYSSFVLTWLIYLSWHASAYSYATGEHFGLALTFSATFFAIFYSMFLAYKLIKKEKFAIGDIQLLLVNSFVYYGIGYSVLYSHEFGKELLGIFTLCNAIIHFIVSTIIYKQKLADKNLFYMISGLVLVFITIAFPVQLDGNWVTLLWAGEAAILFWIGRTKSVAIYEKLAYPLMLWAFFSIIQDWAVAYTSYMPLYPQTKIFPLLNIQFLSSILFIASFSYINFLNQSKKYTSALAPKKLFSKFVSFAIPSILLIAIYFAFRMEISSYWTQLYKDSQHVNNSDYDLIRFSKLWVINYSLLFVSILSFVNFKKLKNENLGMVNLGLNALAIGLFLVEGLYVISQLRDNYLAHNGGVFNIGIRYVSIAFFVLAIVSSYKYVHSKLIKKDLKIPFDLLLHGVILWAVSSELIYWMKIAGFAESYKLGLSILWGGYSLFLISMGIWKNKKHLRIESISLFGVILVKLFFFDISHLNTISKTIVFVSLGLLLLIISFLYNKYKHLISAVATDKINDKSIAGEEDRGDDEN